MSVMLIRKMKTNDHEETFALVVKTWNEYVADTFTKEGKEAFNERLGEIKSKLGHPKYISYVAEENGRIIGMIQGSIREKHGSIGLLFVDKKQHRRGIAHNLMNQIEKDINQKVKVVKVGSSLHAIPFYQKMGYKKCTGIRWKEGMVYQPMKKVM